MSPLVPITRSFHLLFLVSSWTAAVNFPFRARGPAPRYFSRLPKLIRFSRLSAAGTSLVTAIGGWARDNETVSEPDAVYIYISFAVSRASEETEPDVIYRLCNTIENVARLKDNRKPNDGRRGRRFFAIRAPWRTPHNIVCTTQDRHKTIRSRGRITDTLLVSRLKRPTTFSGAGDLRNPGRCRADRRKYSVSVGPQR